MKFINIWCTSEMLCRGNFSHLKWKLTSPHLCYQPCKSSTKRWPFSPFKFYDFTLILPICPPPWMFLKKIIKNSISYTYYNNNLSRGFTFMALFKQRQWILLSKWTHDFSFCTRCPFQDIISERWEFWVKFDQCPYFIFITNLSVH